MLQDSNLYLVVTSKTNKGCRRCYRDSSLVLKLSQYCGAKSLEMILDTRQQGRGATHFPNIYTYLYYSFKLCRHTSFNFSFPFGVGALHRKTVTFSTRRSVTALKVFRGNTFL